MENPPGGGCTFRSNCVWNSLVFSYLASHSEWCCLRCLSFCRWWKTGKHSCQSSIISMSSYSPQYQHSSTHLNPFPSLFLFFFLLPPPFLSFPSESIESTEMPWMQYRRQHSGTSWVLRRVRPHTNNARSTWKFFSFSSPEKGQAMQTTPLTMWS